MVARWVVVGCLALHLGCSHDDADARSDASSSTTSAGASVGAGSGGGSPLPSGTMKEGWKKAFAPDSVGLDCTMTEDQMLAAGAPSLSMGGSC